VALKQTLARISLVRQSAFQGELSLHSLGSLATPSAVQVKAITPALIRRQWLSKQKPLWVHKSESCNQFQPTSLAQNMQLGDKKETYLFTHSPADKFFKIDEPVQISITLQVHTDSVYIQTVVKHCTEHGRMKRHDGLSPISIFIKQLDCLFHFPCLQIEALSCPAIKVQEVLTTSISLCQGLQA